MFQKWIDSQLADIAQKLPELVRNEPASFPCGLILGYKQALLDIAYMQDENNNSHYYCAHCRQNVEFSMMCPCCGFREEL